ncbi:MAG TPA: hypothetical protein VLT81_10075 [Chondromyces sp.]|nr:hypothetical protein [Chondromyces sp.]
MQSNVLDITTENRQLGTAARPALLICAALAVLGIGGSLVLAGMLEHGADHLLETYLVSFAFFLSISLGGLFFVLLQHCTRAGWSVVVRRVAEAVAANVWLMAVLAIPVVLGMDHLYHWTDTAAAAHDPLLAGKIAFLNPTFFVIRLVVYFVLWGLMASYLHRTSVAQDASGDPALTLRMERLSAPGMVVFALSLNFAAFDLLMSLDPHWFSTIFGVYYFAASVVAFLAVMPKILFGLQLKGILPNAVTVEHYHDFGKLLFGFVVFWAYIAFSQYMLIWYGNIPEETQWFLKRQTGDWTVVSLLLIFGHFVLPFLLLVSRAIKRRPALLAVTGAYVAVMCWIDIYWLVIPEFSPAVARFGLLDVLCFLGMSGVFSAAVILRLGRHSVIAEKDPRLEESLAFENA